MMQKLLFVFVKFKKMAMNVAAPYLGPEHFF